MSSRMENRKSGKATSRTEGDERITRAFVRIYYGILNSHPEQLFQFYGDKSTVIVKEFGTGALPLTAESRESIRQLLKKVFCGVTSKIKTAIPQSTVDGGVLLLVSGTLTKQESSSKGGNEHCFTQAMVLAPQKNGYYILNDTLHIMGSFEDEALRRRQLEENAAHVGKFYPSLNGGNSMMPVTPRPNGNVSPLNANRRSLSSEEGTRNNDSDSEESNDRKPKQSASNAKPRSLIQNPHPRPYKPVMAAGSGGSHPNGIPLRVGVGVPPPRPGPGPVKPPGGSGDPRAIAVPHGHGVFIARLPFGIQAEEVEKAFSVFGPVLNGADGIQVRDGRNGCYAFVTFESSASALEAIDKGAIVQGKRVYVEPRIPRQDPVEQNFPVPATAVPPPPPPMPMRLAPMIPPPLAPK